MKWAERTLPKLGNTQVERAVYTNLRFLVDTAVESSKLIKGLARLAASQRTAKGMALLLTAGAAAWAFGLLGDAHAEDLTEVASERRPIVQDLGPMTLGELRQAAEQLPPIGGAWPWID